jgi:hypothetical protein
MLICIIVKIVQSIFMLIWPLKCCHFSLPLFKLKVNLIIIYFQFLFLFFDKILILLTFWLQNHSFHLSFSQQFFLLFDKLKFLIHFVLGNFMALTMVIGSLLFEEGRLMLFVLTMIKPINFIRWTITVFP